MIIDQPACRKSCILASISWNSPEREQYSDDCPKLICWGNERMSRQYNMYVCTICIYITFWGYIRSQIGFGWIKQLIASQKKWLKVSPTIHVFAWPPRPPLSPSFQLTINFEKQLQLTPHFFTQMDEMDEKVELKVVAIQMNCTGVKSLFCWGYL